MVRVLVEALHARGVSGDEERDRIHRRARRAGRVVALRRGDAACDLLAGNGMVDCDHVRMDGAVDRVADLRVVDRALDHPLAARLHVLRAQVDRVVRLVPRRPQRHGRQRRGRRRKARLLLPGRRHEVAAVALRSCKRECVEIVEVGRSVVAARAAVRPRRRVHDREHHLDVVRHCVAHEPVVERPVVRRIAGVGRVGRPGAARHRPGRAAPVQIDAQDLCLERLQRLEAGDRVPVQRVRLVVDADEKVTRPRRTRGCMLLRRGGGCRHGEAGGCEDENGDRGKTLRH